MNAGPDYLEQIATTMVSQVPLLLGYTVGIIVVFLLRRRCPRAAGCALAALVLLFLSSFLGSAVQGYLIADMRARSASTTSQLFAILNVVRTVVHLIAIGLLLCAVFSGRPRPAPADAD